MWTQGMEQWLPATDIAEVQGLFDEQKQVLQSNSVEPSVTEPLCKQPTDGSATFYPMPKTWMIESILVTLLPFIFCCNVLALLGIIGIVKASQVESQYKTGDYASSLESSKDAGRWTKITLWISIGWLFLIILGIIISIVSIGSWAAFSEQF